MRRAVDPSSLPLFALVAVFGVGAAWIAARAEAVAAAEAAVAWRPAELALQRERAALAERLELRAEWEEAVLAAFAGALPPPLLATEERTMELVQKIASHSQLPPPPGAFKTRPRDPANLRAEHRLRSSAG